MEKGSVQLLEEIDRLQILAATVFVGQPLPLWAKIVQVKHGGNRVHPNSVNMKLTDPEQGAGYQEIAHLVATVIKNQRTPFLVLTDAWISMFIQEITIKVCQAVVIFWKMSRHPVQNDANSVLMTAIHKSPELVGLAIATGGGIPTRHLIPPGSLKGMLRDGHQLNMGEAPRLHVGDHLVRQFRVGEQPGPRLHVVGRHR